MGTNEPIVTVVTTSLSSALLNLKKQNHFCLEDLSFEASYVRDNIDLPPRYHKINNTVTSLEKS